jgi:hypothetical protein
VNALVVIIQNLIRILGSASRHGKASMCWGSDPIFEGLYLSELKNIVIGKFNIFKNNINLEKAIFITAANSINTGIVMDMQEQLRKKSMIYYIYIFQN